MAEDRASISRSRIGQRPSLGAVPDAGGTNFAIFSASAERVGFRLFDESGETEIACVTLPEYTNRSGTAIFRA